MNIFVTIAPKDDLCTATRILKDFLFAKIFNDCRGFFSLRLDKIGLAICQ